MTKLFTRHGTERVADLIQKGRPKYILKEKCWRCGGQGGAQAWKHTGWTCYRCKGEGWELPKVKSLYTAEQLAKMDAKLAAKKAKADAEFAAKQAIKAQEVEALKAAWKAAHPVLAEQLAGAQGEFLESLAAQLEERGYLTEAQEEAAVKAIAREAAKAQSKHLGEVGKRIQVAGKVVFSKSYPGQYGSFCVAVMIAECGAKLVAKGSWFPAQDSQVKILASVVAHEMSEGEAITRINRVKEVEG